MTQPIWKALQSPPVCYVVRKPGILRKAIENNDIARVEQLLATGTTVEFPPLNGRDVKQLTEIEFLEILEQDSDLKVAYSAHSFAVFHLLVPAWIKDRMRIVTREDCFRLYYKMSRLNVVGGVENYCKPLVAEAASPAERAPSQNLKFLYNRHHVNEWVGRSIQFAQTWLGQVEEGCWSNSAFYDSWEGREFFFDKLRIFGFAHPKDIQAIGAQLADLKITKALDPCAGRGFLAALLRKYAGLEVEAFDIDAKPGIYHPVAPKTDALCLDYSKVDWQTTVLVLSWVDEPNYDQWRELSFPLIQKAYAANMQYLLLLFERVEGSLCEKTALFIADNFRPLQRHFLHLGGMPRGTHTSMTLYQRSH